MAPVDSPWESPGFRQQREPVQVCPLHGGITAWSGSCEVGDDESALLPTSAELLSAVAEVNITSKFA